MSTRDDRLALLLEDGVRHRLFSGAAIGVSAGGQRTLVTAGTKSYDSKAPVNAGTLFDLASLTKSYTATACMILVDQGLIDLDEPVAGILPVGTGPGADAITLRMLLRHTSGMPATSEIWRSHETPREQKLHAVIRSPLISFPDSAFTYSCTGYIAVGAILERVTGKPLSQVFDELFLRPLALRRTSFGPVDADEAAATEMQPYLSRGVVCGAVHDELSWSLGGVTGNAGLFAPLNEVMIFGETLLRGGLPSDRSLREMTTEALSPRHGAPFGHGLGVRIGDRRSMGTSQGFGHTGFTGTLWVAEPQRDRVVVLLTNRVHPSRTAASILDFRARVFETLSGHEA